MTTPEPGPSVSVSRELLMQAWEALVDHRTDTPHERSEALTRAELALQAALTQPEAPAPALPAERWIPVTERLPEEWQEVLFCIESKQVVCGFRVGEKWYMSDERPINVRTTITHWQPLPKPPTRLRALAGAEVQ